jgi:hypothetical protein
MVTRVSSDDVDELLSQVGQDSALRIVDSDLADKYLIRENGVVIRVCRDLDSGVWKRCIYSNLVNVHKYWIRQAISNKWSSLEAVEIISHRKVPEVEGATCISRYSTKGSSSLNPPVLCSSCGEKFDDLRDHAFHCWDDHGISQDPRDYRDPVQGQQSLGERWK